MLPRAKCFEKCSVAVHISKSCPQVKISDCEVKTFVDCCSGVKFLGLKMLPAGVHYVHYSTVGSNNDVSPPIEDSSSVLILV